jgi:hypothetical protein
MELKHIDLDSLQIGIALCAIMQKTEKVSEM